MRRRQGRCDGLGLYRLLAGKALRSLVAKRLFCLKSVPAFIRVDWNGIVVERAGSGQIDRPLAVHSFAHPTPRFVRLLTPLLLHPIRFRRRPLFRSPLFFHQGGSRQFHLLIDPSLPPDSLPGSRFSRNARSPQRPPKTPRPIQKGTTTSYLLPYRPPSLLLLQVSQV